MTAMGAILVALLFFIGYFVELAVWVMPYDFEASMLSGFEMSESFAEDSDEVQARLQELTTELAAGWPENPYTLRVRVIEGEPNAFALPGGQIWVTRGLLDQAGSENEIAFVLGHEIGHFRDRDHLRGLSRGVLFTLVAAGLGLGGVDSLFGSGVGLVGLSFSRDQERDADAFGLELVHRHYGHVMGSWHFFERLSARDGVASKLPAFVQTHPGSDRRVEDLLRQADRNGYSISGELRHLPTRGDP